MMGRATENIRIRDIKTYLSAVNTHLKKTLETNLGSLAS